MVLCREPETAEKRSSKRLRKKRHQTILLIKICGGKATTKCEPRIELIFLYVRSCNWSLLLELSEFWLTPVSNCVKLAVEPSFWIGSNLFWWSLQSIGIELCCWDSTRLQGTGCHFKADFTKNGDIWSWWITEIYFFKLNVSVNLVQSFPCSRRTVDFRMFIQYFVDICSRHSGRGESLEKRKQLPKFQSNVVHVEENNVQRSRVVFVVSLVAHRLKHKSDAVGESGVTPALGKTG